MKNWFKHIFALKTRIKKRPLEIEEPFLAAYRANIKKQSDANKPDWVQDQMILEGKNPNRIMNDIDANRPKTVEQLANDPLTKFFERTGNKMMADRMRRGDLSSQEYAQGLQQMKNEKLV